ncbi:MAG: YihY/virulence factor BrkB family protein [Acidimicrobiia bacterium]|nr:YihY/virulence factor BrkB family protein [Acidimicrobiia bacterium]MDH3471077.1 YihY/virulence factor BrkB family protein [Acidimicrobiia bacterium]
MNISIDPMHLWQISRRFWVRFQDADPGLMAAAVAFNAFLASVPLAIAFAAAGSLVGASGEGLARTKEALDLVAPAEVADFMIDLLTRTAELVDGQQWWIIIVSALVAVYSGSRGLNALQKALRRIDHMDERRTTWTRRLVAIGLTLAGGLALVALIVALVLTEPVAEFFEKLTRIDVLTQVWAWLRFPVAAGVVYLYLLAVYHFGPPRPIPSTSIAAAVGTVVALAASFGFGIYLSVFGLSGTFGVLGAVGVGLLWLYFTAYAILFGAAVVSFRQVVRSGSGHQATEG